MDNNKHIERIEQKLDDFLIELPNIITDEFNENLVSIGIDPEKKIEFQGLMIWTKKAMERENQITQTITTSVTSWIIKGIFVLAVAGFVMFYNNKQINIALRDKKIEQGVIVDGEEKP